MIETLAGWRDKLLGRGEAAITIPTLDGALKPNRLLEDAEVLATLEAPEDLATDGKDLFVADGNRILRLAAGRLVEEARFDAGITAVACLPFGGLAVALDGTRIRLVGGAHDGTEWKSASGSALRSVNAITAASRDRLLVTEGSASQPCQNWCHDLMERGKSGRIMEFRTGQKEGTELRRGLRFAFGCCVAGESEWVSETWAHRLMRIDRSGNDKVVVDWLPGYPGRITAASSGGYWLCAFAGRTQLVEFVLREKAFRKRMMKEVDPRYWIAPALGSGDDFLEPLQGAGVKMRGVLKPYAPPRSYGLVIRLDQTGTPISSLHSRLDGKNHGAVAAVECRGNLFVLVKGPRRILQIPLSAT